MNSYGRDQRVYSAILVILGAALLFGGRALFEGIGPRPLSLGVPYDRTIAPGKVHTYTLSLDEGRFAYVAAEQQGVDVVVRVLSSDGDTIMVVDSPNGRWGVEPVYFTNRAAGEYTLVVSVLRPEAPPGRYSIALTQEGPAATSVEDRVRQLFLPWGREGYPGASIAVTRDGKVVYSDGFGEAQLEYGIPITSSTVFPIASVSKQFTAFAVAMLVVGGRLSLDDDIREYLPEMPDFGEVITVGHLVHHTSGLRNWWFLLPLAGLLPEDVYTQDQVLRVMSKQRDLNFPPGEEREYCNTGYLLLATIVSRVTGTPFPQWMEEEVFGPLGMADTRFVQGHEQIIPGRAYSYEELPSGELRKAVLSDGTVGSRGLFTTSLDLARWMVNLDEGTVGGEEVLRLLQDSRTVLNNGDALPYAMGLDVGTYRGLKTVGHSGLHGGFRTYAVRFPDQRLSVNVLGNVSSMSPSRLALTVASLYLEEEMVDAGGEGPDEPSYLRMIEEGESFPSTREVRPIDPEMVDLEEYEGRYYSPELATFYELIVDGEGLWAHHIRLAPVFLTPVGVDAFAGGRAFFADVQMERSGDGRVVTMLVSSSGVRNVRFERVDGW